MCVSIIVICLPVKITEFDRNNFIFSFFLSFFFFTFFIWMRWPAFIDTQNMFMGQVEIKSILNMSESIRLCHITEIVHLLIADFIIWNGHYTNNTDAHMSEMNIISTKTDHTLALVNYLRRNLTPKIRSYSL